MIQTANQIKYGYFMQILQHINENMARKKCYAIKMYSTHNKEKYVVAERFIRIFKKKHKIHDFSFKKDLYWWIRWYI